MRGPSTHRRWIDLLLFAVAAGVSAAFILDFCHWFFDCGCRSWWAGATSHCNIHAPGPPDCPWCRLPGWAALTFVGAPILLGQALAIGLLRRAPAPLRLVAALALFPALGALCAVAVRTWFG